MTKFGIIFALVAGLFPISGMSAQSTGTRLGAKPASAPTGDVSKEDTARVIMRSFSRCVIGVSPMRVTEYLDTFPASAEARNLVNILSRDECLAGGELRFEEKLFRWATYDELYNVNFRKFEPSKVTVVAETDYAALAQGVSADRLQIIALWDLGECTVRAAPTEADALVKSAIASKAESAAMTAIVPFLGSCVAKDNKITFSKAVIRGLLAEALYKIATKAEIVSTAQVKK